MKVQQKKANDLNNRIERIIAEEIRKAEAKRIAAAKKKAEEENRRIAAENKRIAEQNRQIAAQNKRIDAENKTKKASKAISRIESKPTIKPVTVADSSPSRSVSALTKEESLLSGDFARNQGRLPWPTSNGFIRGHFGIQSHPVLKFVTTNNKGIYIQTPSGSSARAVFDGVVTQVFYIQGNNGVIVQHGNYRTVYANLTQIYVRVGEHISSKQSIGKIYTDSENDNRTELYFQVYNGKNVQNPENWIAR